MGRSRHRSPLWLRRGHPAFVGTLYHLTDGRQWGVDTLYLVPQFLGAAGQYEEAVRQADGLYRRLHDPQSGLMAHRWDEEAQRLIAPVHWGVGNGWALAGMTRVQALLPEAYAADCERLRERVRHLLSALRPHMRPDGLFHNMVDDSSTFVETNLSQMVSYTIYRGCAQGWLDTTLIPWADAMLLAASAQVDELGLVRGVCGAPDFAHPGTAPEGQAFHLLMAQAHQDWQSNERSIIR